MARSAAESVKDCLQKVKVSKTDAQALEKELQRELLDSYTEKCEVSEAKAIPIKDISEYLDHMKEAYEGIDDQLRKKMDGIKWAGEWSNKMCEFQYSSDQGKTRYGMVGLGKSPDRKFVDCMYVAYNINFKLAKTKSIRQGSYLWGLISWDEVVEEKRNLKFEDVNRLKNFFRFKALEGFYSEGLIDFMTDVPSVKDVNFE